MDKTEERLRILAEAFSVIPEEKQQGIVYGVQMLAALYNYKNGKYIMKGGESGRENKVGKGEI